ncbi:hypothetical protein AB3N04_07225 [Alkalihalophilus sp. As8PL]|uniref:Uncharacterized protein n=1 Tax=Alkalihalophilus sp. As8PL TaxID=3237103 RepID=A0AB39BXS7_9BACI
MDHIRAWFMQILIGVYLVHTFFVIPHGDKMLAVLTFIVIVLLLNKLKGFSKVISSMMLLIGFILVMYTEQYENVKNSLIVNLPLVVLLVTVPVLGFPLRFGKYDKQLSNFIKRYGRNDNRLFLAITTVFFIIGPVINMGSIKLIDNLLNKLSLSKGLLARSYMQGFTATLLWSPFFASLLLVLNLVGVSLYSYLPFAIPVAITHLFVSNLLFSRIGKYDELPLIANQAVRMKKIYELITVFILFFLAVFIIDWILTINMITSVTIAACLIASIWSIYLKSIHVFGNHLREYRKKTILLSSNEVVLFLTAGFFGSVISNTTLGEYINRAILVIGESSILLMILSIILLTTALSMIGVHQIVTISALAATVNPLVVGLEPVAFALTLMSAWIIATIVSPISAANAIITTLVNRTYFEIAIKYNGPFIVLMTIVYTMCIYIVQMYLS